MTGRRALRNIAVPRHAWTNSTDRALGTRTAIGCCVIMMCTSNVHVNICNCFRNLGVLVVMGFAVLRSSEACTLAVWKLADYAHTTV